MGLLCSVNEYPPVWMKASAPGDLRIWGLLRLMAYPYVAVISSGGRLHFSYTEENCNQLQKSFLDKHLGCIYRKSV